jgi:hypothetical protein
MRKLIGLAVIVGLFVAGDAALRSYAESTVARRLERDLDPGGSVEVSLGGFPFVAGLLTESIPSASVVAHDVERKGLRVDRLTVDAEGLEISLTEADRRTGAAEIDEGRGEAFIRLRVLARFLERNGNITSVRIGKRGVTVRIPSSGRAVTAPLRLEDGRIIIRAPTIEDIVVPLPGVFSGVRYSTIEVTGDLAQLSFRLKNVALRSL